MAAIELQRMLEMAREGVDVIVKPRELDLSVHQIMHAFNSYDVSLTRLLSSRNVITSDVDRVIYAEVDLSYTRLLHKLRDLFHNARDLWHVQVLLNNFEEKIMFKQFDDVRQLLEYGNDILNFIADIKQDDIRPSRDLEEIKSDIVSLQRRWEKMNVEIRPVLLDMLKKLASDLHLTLPPAPRSTFSSRYAHLTQTPPRRSSRTTRPSQRKVESDVYLASSSSSRAVASTSSSRKKSTSSKNKYSSKRISSRTRSRTKTNTSKKRKVSKRTRSK